MKINLLLIWVFLIGVSAFAQDRKNQYQIIEDTSNELILAFTVTNDTDDVLNQIIEFNPTLHKYIDENQLNFVPVLNWSDDHYQKLKLQAITDNENAQSVMNLKGLYRLIGDYDNETLLKHAKNFEMYEVVRYADFNTLTPISPPNIDIPPTTPNYLQSQGYIKPNPGVDMEYAWSLGLTGTGIKVRDVEFGMSTTHEELTDPKFSNEYTIHYSVDPSFIDHGTATAGVMAAHNGNYGVTGMVHDISEFKVFPEYSYWGYNRVDAIIEAINTSAKGDVILYELQTGGLNSTNATPNYVPGEFVNTVWDLTKAATDAGIHIVAAAGNGNQNLDAPGYASYLNRGDSGAIIVGAGEDAVTHGRLSFSTYGSRVDVQGWGTNVLTTGYGGYSKIGNDPNQSYNYFSGTSSATPVVASCVVALLQRAKQSNVDLKPTEVRMILKNTGFAQQKDTSRPIGPLPNMKSAITYLDNYLLSSNKQDAIPVILYPNPANDVLYLDFEERFNENTLSIIDITGRIIKRIENYSAKSPISLLGFTSGTYFVKLQSGKTIQTKKIIVK